MNDNQISTIRNWLCTGSIDIFGLPFAGKDSQGNRLVETLGAPPLIGGGDILRNSVIPPEAQAIIDQGGLSPTDVFLTTVLPYLSQPKLVGQPLILSSLGRWKGEEAGVIQALEQANHPLKAVVYLQLDESRAWERWSALQADEDPRGVRRDDSEEAFAKRFKEFETKTIPVLEHYQSMGLRIDIDASKSKDDVFNDIISELYTFSRK